MKEWTVRAECPHGLHFDLPFDELGYLRGPKLGACEKLHPPIQTEPATPSRFRMWRETRRFRRALRKH